MSKFEDIFEKHFYDHFGDRLVESIRKHEREKIIAIIRGEVNKFAEEEGKWGYLIKKPIVDHLINKINEDYS